MNPEDRAVVDNISKDLRENTKILRALSSTLIGRVNGDTVDEGGGRIGRLEKFVWWIFTGLIAIGVWLGAQMVARLIK